METVTKQRGDLEIPNYDQIPSIGGFRLTERLAGPQGLVIDKETLRRPFRCGFTIESGYRGNNGRDRDNIHIIEMIFDGDKYLFFGHSSVDINFTLNREDYDRLIFPDWVNPINGNSEVSTGLLPERLAFIVDGILAIPVTAHVVDQMKSVLLEEYESILAGRNQIDGKLIMESYRRVTENLPRLEFGNSNLHWLGEIMFAVAWREARKEINFNKMCSLTDEEYLDFQLRFQELLKIEMERCVADSRFMFSYYTEEGELNRCGQLNISLLWSYIFTNKRFEGTHLYFNDMRHAAERDVNRLASFNWRTVWKERFAEQGVDGLINLVGIPACGKSTLMLALSLLLTIEDRERLFVGDVLEPKSTAHQRPKGILGMGLSVRRPVQDVDSTDLRIIKYMSAQSLRERLPENARLAGIYDYLRYLGYTRNAILEIWEKILSFGKYYHYHQYPYRGVLLQGAFEGPLIARIAVERTFDILDALQMSSLINREERSSEAHEIPDEFGDMVEFQTLPILQKLIFDPVVSLSHSERKLVLGAIGGYQGELDELIVHSIEGICLDVPPVLALERYRQDARGTSSNNRLMWLRYSPIIRLINLVLAKEYGWEVIQGTYYGVDGLESFSPLKLALQYRLGERLIEQSIEAQRMLAGFYDPIQEEVGFAMSSRGIDESIEAISRVQRREDFPVCFSTDQLPKSSPHKEILHYRGDYEKRRVYDSLEI